MPGSCAPDSYIDGQFTGLVTLKSHVIIANSFQGKEGKIGAWGKVPRKILVKQTFQSKENALFNIKRALQNRQFRCFAEKGKGPDPQEPPSCVPVLYC